MSKQHTFSKPIRYCGENCTMFVEYGIDYEFADRNKQSPYFSITGSIYKNRADGTCNKVDRNHMVGGCIHEEILKHAPKFADLVAFHLRHDDGSPSHATENGLFMVECCLGLENWNNFPIERCQQWAADHFMVSIPEVLALCDKVEAANVTIMSRPPKGSDLAPMRVFSGVTIAEAKEKVAALNADQLKTPGRWYYVDKSEAKKIVSELVDKMTPVWKEAPDNLIKKYDLGRKS